MDVDDDDAFLYGEQSPPPASAPKSPPAAATPAAVSVSAIPSSQQLDQPTPAALPSLKDVQDAAGLSASMAASLAAYGIDPSTAVAAENPEDGGVEEEEPDDEEDDSEEEDSDDDVKLVFSGTNSRLDLRKPQTAPSNVIGIGKWAHTSTGAVATPSTPQHVSGAAATPTRAPAPTANQTTEYNPAPRPTPTPSGTSTTTNAMINPAIPPSTEINAPNLLQPPSVNAPPSNLPAVTASSTQPKIDPTNPSGLIPSTGQSVFEIDMSQFESSGQPWRRPGSDLSDWFNFGFDEVTYPKYLRFKSDMEQGRAMLANLPPMAGVPPELAQLFHLQSGMDMMQMNNLNANVMNQMNAMAQMNMGNMNMGNMGNMGQMGNGGFNPQMQAQLQQMMALQGMDMGMNGGGAGFGMQGQGGVGQQGMGMQYQGMQRPGAGINRPSATPVPQVENGEEVKQEDGVSNAGGETPLEAVQGSQAMRGRGMPLRGMPTRGMAMPVRGRGTVPLGPRGAIPTGPKAGRFRDKDRVDTSGAGSLDYGASEGAGESEKGSMRGGSVGVSRSTSRSKSRSRSASPKRSRRNERDRRSEKARERERERSYDYSSGYESERKERERRRSRRRDKDREYDDDSKSKRKRDRADKDRESQRDKDEGGSAAALGPEGWESEGEDERRSSRRKRSPSEEEDRPRRSKRR